MNRQEVLSKINIQIAEIIQKMILLEDKYKHLVKKVHPEHRKSALNLIHYMAFRSFNIDKLQDQLNDLGLPDLANIEGHVASSLYSIENLINALMGVPKEANGRQMLSIKKSRKLLKKNTKNLFGYKPKKRKTRIMVTLPASAAIEYKMIRKLISLGMNVARINCSHDSAETWRQMVENIHRANKALKRNCKIVMDLGGPKLRTGSMQPGAKVVHIKQSRDQYGNVIKPAKVWIAPPGVLPPNDAADVIIPVSKKLAKKVKKGNTIYFVDSRGKKCKINVIQKQKKGRWGICSDSAYISTGTALVLNKTNKTGNVVNHVGELLPVEQFIRLHIGEVLILDRKPILGEPAVYDEAGKVLRPAHISCTLPEVFDDVQLNEPILFNDGKIEGQVKQIMPDKIIVKITYAKEAGAKLKADKGINLPHSDLSIRGLTSKDKEDLVQVSKWADAVNLSFVNQPDDVEDFLIERKNNHSKMGLIVKIETQKGFKNLPEILLQAMQIQSIGVLIARGDLAIETGWKNFSTIQEEILRISEAAHLPVIWATQVLENLAKKGIPTRSEITDATLAQRAECVMLNKGVYIGKAIKTLDKILRRAQKFNNKQQTILPRMDAADRLELSHEKFDIR